MRDKRFVAEHRGGPLKKEQHKQLIGWACTCTEHLFSILPCEPDKRLVDALSVAYRWECGNAAVGEARKAALKCIEAARESDDPVIIAVSRAAGHAVATAHMADHSLGPALYGLKAVKLAGGHAVATAHMADHSLGPALYGLKAVKLAGRSVEDERNWQNNQLPAEIRELVISARTVKEKSFRI